VPRSKRHHYLPVFYLRGFCNSEGRIWIYDKTKDKFFQTRPENVFVVNDLNTLTYDGGEKKDFLEALYSYTDGIAAPLVDKVVRSTVRDVPLTDEEKYQLTVFVTALFLRVPAQEQFVMKTLARIGLNNPYFRMLDRRTGRIAPKEVLDTIAGDPEIEKVYRSMLTFVPQIASKNRLSAGEFLFMYQDPGFVIVSDNPVVYHKAPMVEELLDEFILPISSNRILFRSDRIKREAKSPHFTIQLDAALLHQADRYIGFYRLDYLQTIVGYYKMFRSQWAQSQYLDALFQ